MAMNNLAYDPMTGQPVDPMANQLGSAVYNNQGVVTKANQVFGTPGMMQSSVAYVQPQVDTLTGMSVVNPNQKQIT
jgi:hypothetical protein